MAAPSDQLPRVLILGGKAMAPASQAGLTGRGRPRDLVVVNFGVHNSIL